MDMLIAFHMMSHQALHLETGQGVPTSTKERANGIRRQDECRVAGRIRRRRFLFRLVIGSYGFCHVMVFF